MPGSDSWRLSVPISAAPRRSPRRRPETTPSPPPSGTTSSSTTPESEGGTSSAWDEILVLGSLASFVADAVVQAHSVTAIAEVRITEPGGGTAAGRVLDARVVGVARKVNLDPAEATAALVDRMARSIAGLFPEQGS